MKIDLSTVTIDSAHKAFARGDYSPADLIDAYKTQIAQINPKVHAYLEVFDDVSASVSDSTSDTRPLAGIVCGIKDNILIKGRISSSSSKILEHYTATYDATVIQKLRDAGAVFIGRTNMDEFAMGGSTENSAYGPTMNPHDTSRVAGGSSGGSAAAVAMNGAVCALGSDTGGSIRQPASFCGLVGLKPTYGAVSRYGVMAMGSSLDQIGPITKTVKDAETIFNIIKGKDPKDSTTIDTSVEHPTYPKKRIGVHKPVIGIPRHFLTGDGIDPDVMASFEKAIASFKAKGYEVKDISLPHIGYSLAVYYVLMPAEVSSNMARYDGMRFGMHKDGKDGIDDYFETRRAGFGREVIRRILLGTYVLSSGYHDAYYNRANAVRKMITDDFHATFESVDLILTPTTPSPAFTLGEKLNDPVAMYLEDIFTVTANLTGMPALSVPCGFAERQDNTGAIKRLPLGLQMTARHGDEETLFEAGKEFLGE